jgi:hypothetical protein
MVEQGSIPCHGTGADSNKSIKAGIQKRADEIKLYIRADVLMMPF